MKKLPETKIIKDQINISINFECISKTNNNTYCMECTGNERIKKLCDWLWNEKLDFKLDRKYFKYLELTEQQNNRSFLKKTSRSSYFKANSQ